MSINNYLTKNMVSKSSVNVTNAYKYLHRLALRAVKRGDYYAGQISNVSKDNAAKSDVDFIHELYSNLQHCVDENRCTNPIGYLLKDKDPFTQTDCILNRRFRSAMTKFISSDGVLVILNNTGFLWVDSRYYPSATLHCAGTDIVPQLLVKPLDWIQTFDNARLAEHNIEQHKSAPVADISSTEPTLTPYQTDTTSTPPTNDIVLICDRLTTSIDEYNSWKQALPSHVQLIAIDYTDSPYDVPTAVDGIGYSLTTQTGNQNWLIAYAEKFFNTKNEQQHAKRTNNRFANNNIASAQVGHSNRTIGQFIRMYMFRYMKRVFHIPSRWYDTTIEHRLQSLREEMKQHGCTHLIHTESADICWLFQIRGWDYHNNQLFPCAMIIDSSNTKLYCTLHSFTYRQKKRLRQLNIDIAPLENFSRDITTLCSHRKLLPLSSHSTPIRSSFHNASNLRSRHRGTQSTYRLTRVASEQLNDSSNTMRINHSSNTEYAPAISSSDDISDNSNINIAVDVYSTSVHIYQLVLSVPQYSTPLIFWKQQLYKKERVVAAIAQAAISEGCSLVKFNVRLQDALAKQNKPVGRNNRSLLTENSVAKMVERAQRSHRSFLQPSFDSIVGYMEHGAFIHYNHRQEPTAPIESSGILLLDCGGHYRYGTTDITRVLLCGTPTEQHIKDYTNVLKALIAGSTVTVTAGCCGAAIDSHTRKLLKRQGLDYAHGTGHGIGYCYNVHLGSEGLSSRSTKPLIQDGYVCSMEPGLYRIGEHGIRLENMIVFLDIPDGTPQSTNTHGVLLANRTINTSTSAVTHHPTDNNVVTPQKVDTTANTVHNAEPHYPDKKNYDPAIDKISIDNSTPNSTLKSHTITRFPFERDLIATSLLTTVERDWINTYHAQVYADLTPHLSRRYKQWLREATAPLP